MIKLTAKQRQTLFARFLCAATQDNVEIVLEELPGGIKCPTITISNFDHESNTGFEFKAFLSIESLYELGIDETPFLTEDHDGEE